MAGLGMTVAVGTSAAAPGPVYGVFTLADTGGTVELAPGFPSATFATDSVGPSVPSGASSYLNANTPVGAAYGSSANQGYLNLRAAAGSSTSTTTYTFTTGTPSGGWSFVLGDVDADTVTISATSPEGVAVATADLGYQGAFNYCLTPVPGSCTGTIPGTDVPSWNAATGVLTGNGPDTTGASAWFSPSVSLGTLTLVFAEQSGSPIYQTWFATQTRSIAGVVAGPSGTAGITVDVLDDASVVVATTTTLADGGYLVDGLAPGSYLVRMTPPDGYIAAGETEVLADLTDNDQSGVDFEIAAEPPPTTSTEPTTTEPTTTESTTTEPTTTEPTTTEPTTTEPTTTEPTTTEPTTTEPTTTEPTTTATSTTTASATATPSTSTSTTASPVTSSTSVLTTTVTSYVDDPYSYDDPAAAVYEGGYQAAANRSLAATGVHTAPLLTTGLAMMGAGGILLWGGDRRHRVRRRPHG